jgi:hypothetical protein
MNNVFITDILLKIKNMNSMLFHLFLKIYLCFLTFCLFFLFIYIQNIDECLSADFSLDLLADHNFFGVLKYFGEHGGIVILDVKAVGGLKTFSVHVVLFDHDLLHIFTNFIITKLLNFLFGFQIILMWFIQIIFIPFRTVIKRWHYFY